MKRELFLTVLALVVMGVLVLPAHGVPSHQFDATTPVEAQQWKSDGVDLLRPLLYGEQNPTTVPLNAELLCRREDTGSYIYELYEITTRTNWRTLVHVGIPKNVTGKCPVLLGLHGHGTGDWKGASLFNGSGSYRFGNEMANNGFIVVAPDMTPGGGKPVLYNGPERDWPGPDQDYSGTQDGSHLDAPGWNGWTLPGQRTWDAMRALDFILTRDDADAGRVACMGHSMGGEISMHVGALETRLRALVTSGWLTCGYGEGRPCCTTNNCNTFLNPGFLDTFRCSDICGLSATRPLMIQTGETDLCVNSSDGTNTDAFTAFAQLEEIYTVFGVPGDLTHAVHPGGHDPLPLEARLWIEGQFEAVPEPGTMLLLGTGVLGLAGVIRRRRRSSEFF